MTDELFPYASWLHREGFRSPYCLTASGMPAPDPALLGAATALLDLGPAPLEALPALEARLAELFGVEPERVVATPGAIGAMHAIALASFPGAHVVVERPAFEAFPVLARLHAASTAVVERRARDGFTLAPAAARDALAAAGGRPAHLFLCQPHNPTGAQLAPREVQELARLAGERGGLLISNEVYMEFAQPDERYHAFHLAPNTISIGSLTKAYGLGALRIGWCVLGEGAQEHRAVLADRLKLFGLDLPTPSLRAARAALDRLPALLKPVRATLAAGRPALEQFLARESGFEGMLGPLTPFAFPRVQGVDDTRAFARELAAEEGVDAVPGEFFGCPGHLRISCAVPEATLEEGLTRLARARGAVVSRSSAASRDQRA